MKLVSINYKSPSRCPNGLALCLGYFDGVHIGHQELIRHGLLNRISDGIDNLSFGVLTFDNPISKFRDNGKSKEVLNSVNDRMSRINKVDNVDYLCVVHVDQHLCDLTPDEFITMLKKMNVKQVFCGEDYRFGKDAEGDVELLKKHFIVNVFNFKNPFHEKISTHSIIKHLKEGNVELANKELGYHYAMSGKVVKGKKKGRDIGFPTINLNPDAQYVLPKFGVYKSRVVLGVKEYLGITNVGVRPTFEYEEEKPGIETHLIDASVDDVYGEKVLVTFEEFIRDEKKFESVEELTKQIQSDVERVKK